MTALETIQKADQILKVPVHEFENELIEIIPKVANPTIREKRNGEESKEV